MCHLIVSQIHKTEFSQIIEMILHRSDSWSLHWNHLTTSPGFLIDFSNTIKSCFSEVAVIWRIHSHFWFFHFSHSRLFWLVTCCLLLPRGKLEMVCSHIVLPLPLLCSNIHLTRGGNILIGPCIVR